MPAFDLTNELSAMRAAVASVLPDTCAISRLREVSDGQGGMVQSWAAVGTVSCRLAANSGQARAVAGQAQSVGAYILTVPYDTDIQFADRATVNSVVYRVAFVNDVNDWRTAIRCDVNAEVF